MREISDLEVEALLKDHYCPLDTVFQRRAPLCDDNLFGLLENVLKGQISSSSLCILLDQQEKSQ